MKNGAKVSFTIIACILGFMIAILFHSVKEPEVRMTKDIWSLRSALSNEKKLQSRLLEEIRLNEKRFNEYASEKESSKEAALEQTLNQLQEEAGLTPVEGPGIILTVDTISKSFIRGQTVHSVSPVVLKRLINELNRYGAKYISVDGERIINTTVIRDINGDTNVNTHPLTLFPFQIKVITDSVSVAEKMYNRMKISPSLDDFFIDDLQITISEPGLEIEIPAYVDPIRIRYMKPENSKGED
ncbi:DUF881 domain-containing protein [Pseudogracilibacillus auburnensis]|uniref:DUF881 domain-containing protein n=1 Tax=Pseudogracilibacillus auburnensis TaxID=1494959 RepID=UPI001A958DE4|nr:DUF881 domain-containing protein [Pseudogracilibacillus auburnensis]MBO1004940.1 DUF881 domain-containing protein [Pseudogracilibacillus auburnensis]